MDDKEVNKYSKSISNFFEKVLTREPELLGRIKIDPEGLHLIVYEWNGRIYKLNEQGIAIALEKAKESADAFDYCKELSAENLGKFDLLDNFAKAILKDELLRPKAKRGRKSTNEWRDINITMGVRLAIAFGLPEYANGESKKETACSLVESILINEFGIACDVTSIWKKDKNKSSN
jgi:hypothetical protein